LLLFALDWLSFHAPFIHRCLHRRPVCLVRDGRVLHNQARHELAGRLGLLHTSCAANCTSFAHVFYFVPSCRRGVAREFFWRADWGRLFTPEMSLPELLVRGSLTYLAVCLLLRVVLKRQAGKVRRHHRGRRARPGPRGGDRGRLGAGAAGRQRRHR
jgi:hypothetical protein